MNNNSRTIGIIAIIVTVLCCACPGLGLAIAGLMGLAGVPFTTTINDRVTSQPIPPQLALGLLCLSLFLIVIPLVVAFFTFRKKPAPAVVPPVDPNIDGPIPPAS